MKMEKHFIGDIPFTRFHTQSRIKGFQCFWCIPILMVNGHQLMFNYFKLGICFIKWQLVCNSVIPRSAGRQSGNKWRGGWYWWWWLEYRKEVQPEDPPEVGDIPELWVASIWQLGSWKIKDDGISDTCCLVKKMIFVRKLVAVNAKKRILLVSCWFTLLAYLAHFSTFVFLCIV